MIQKAVSLIFLLEKQYGYILTTIENYEWTTQSGALSLGVAGIKRMQVQKRKHGVAPRNICLQWRVDPIHPWHGQSGAGLKVHLDCRITWSKKNVSSKLCRAHSLGVVAVLEIP